MNSEIENREDFHVTCDAHPRTQSLKSKKQTKKSAKHLAE